MLRLWLTSHFEHHCSQFTLSGTQPAEYSYIVANDSIGNSMSSSRQVIIEIIRSLFPKQFTVGVLNSILKCVRLVSGAVSASGRFVFQFICLPTHLSPRSCVRGCVRLRTICLPIQKFVSQFICLPGPVSGAVSASGGFVSQFICLPIHLSPRSCVRGCVRLRTICLPIQKFVSQFICLPIHLSPRSLSPNSFVSQVLWQGLCPPPGDWFPNSFVSQFICLPGPVSGAVSAFGGFVSQFVCLPSFVSQVLCPGLCPHFRDLSPIICLPSFVSHHLSPRSCVRGCVHLVSGVNFGIRRKRA